MQQECVTLKWGDVVRILGVNVSKKKTTKGLIMSKGFTDPNLYYQLYEDFAEVNFYRESLFQIYPRANFDMHDQLLNQSVEQDQQQAIKTRAEGQITQFESGLEFKAGKQIKYGSEVVFMHVQSKGYLEGMLKAADFGEGAFRVEVSDHLSSFAVFKIVSHRSYESQNDKVYFNDALQIYHPKSDSFINFEEQQKPIYLDTKEELKSIPPQHLFYQFSQNRPSIKRPVGTRISIINQNKSKCLWKFIQHCTYEAYNNKEKIKSHDIVYFQHTKIGEESLVSSTITGENNQYYLKKSKEEHSYECFWELIPKQVNQLGPEEPDAFWARNIVTGRLLSYNGFNVQIQQDGQSSGAGFDNRGLINLICSEGDQFNEPLKLERGFPIISSQYSPIQLHYQKNFTKNKLTAVSKLPKDIFKIFKVEEQIIIDAEYVLTSHEPLVKIVENFASKLLDEKDNDDFDFVKQFFQTLDGNALEGIINILKLLAGKIYGTDYDNIVQSGNTPNKNIQKILVETGIAQLLIEIISLLYKPFQFIQQHPEPSEDRAIRMKISQIFQNSYNLLGNIAVGYELNRIYISRWIDLFLKHSNNINKPFIQECIVGILQNNPTSIQATITEQKIINQINCFFAEASNCSESLTTKYLRLFSTFIRCEDAVIKENQNIILNHFFKNPNNQYNFRFKFDYRNEYDDQNDPFKVKSKEVIVAFHHGQFMTLPTFFKEEPGKWNYLLAYVNLLADICMDRNNEAIQSVSGILSLQNVAVILFDQQIFGMRDMIEKQNEQAGQIKYHIINIHEPFIRIAHHVYVQNDKFLPIERITKISNWYKEEVEIEDINKTKRTFEGEKEEEQQRYLQSILEYIKQYLRNCDQSAKNLNILLIVLNLLKSTVILGLWKSIKFFREIAPLLVLRIAKIDDDIFFNPSSSEFRSRKGGVQFVEANKQTLSMNRPQIAQSIECKIKATQIYKYMNELQTDIRLRYVMNFFKGLYETTENFNDYDLPEQQNPNEDADEAEIARDQRAKQQYKKIDRNYILGHEVQKVTEDVEILMKESIWYNKLKQMTPFTYVPTDSYMKDRYFFQSQKDGDQEPDYEKDFNTIMLALCQIPIYRDHRLLNSSLIMLRAMFEQRKQLLVNFNKILICGRGNLEEVYDTLKSMRSKFSMLANASINKYEGDSDKAFSYDIWKPYDYIVKDRDKRSGIIQDLFFLARTLKEGTSLRNIESLMHVDPQIFNSEQVYTFFSEKQKNNELFQALNLAEGIYLPLIEYIKIINKREQITENHRKLLIAIYQYLTMFCFDNLETKQILMQYIPYVLRHLGEKVGADTFLLVVSRNNKLLVSNEELVTLIITQSLQKCVQLESKEVLGTVFFPSQGGFLKSNDYERSRILYSLRGVILYNEEGHKRNQQILMNKLQDTRFRTLVFQGTFQYKDKINNFSLSPTESFIAYHFELLSVLVESSNLINIGKLSNVHKYPYCLQNLAKTNRWEIRRALRAYINRLYYVNNDKDIFLFEQFIRKEFDIINKQLSDLVQLHKSKLLTTDLKIKNGIRFIYAQSQIYLVIIQILVTLQEMFLKPQFLKLLRNQLVKQQKITDAPRELHEKLIRLYKYIGCLAKLYPETKTITAYLFQIKILLDQQLQKLQLRYLQKKSEPDDEGYHAQNEEKQAAEESQKKNSYSYDHSRSFFRNLHQMMKFLHAKEKLDKLKQDSQNRKNEINIPESDMKKKYLEAIFKVENEKLRAMYLRKEPPQVVHYNPHLQTANSRIFKVLAKPEFDENRKNIELNQRLKAVKKMIDYSPVFAKFKDDEFINLVRKFIALNQVSQKHYKNAWAQLQQKERPVISTQQIIKQTFRMMMKYPDQIADNEKVFIIKIARCYITEAVEEKQNYKLMVDKWDPQYCAQSPQLNQRQKIIEICGGSDFLISILKEDLTSRIQLLNEALLLGIAYLFGGTTICQNSVLESMKKDPNNQMLISLRHMIKTIGDFLINVRKFKEHEKQKRFNYSLPDTYDYFAPGENMILKYFSHPKADKYEQMIQQQNQKALCRMFRFLQLLCENDNVPMKKFLATQTNLDDTKKTNSINFIEEACGLLKKIFKVMNVKLVSIPANLLAFIGEITQLPVLENQISLMKSTFFEDISYLASFFNESKNRKKRKFNSISTSDQDPVNMLTEVYTQAIKLAISNFEGNESVLMAEFLNKCQPRFLWLVIRENLWNLIKDRYSHEEFFVQYVPTKLDEQEQPDRKSMLLTFEKLDNQTLQYIIDKEKIKSNQNGQSTQNQDYLFKDEILGIIDVLIILRKVHEYALLKTKLAFADKQSIKEDENKEAFKAQQFKSALMKYGQEQLPAFHELNVIFQGLILQIEVKCDNGKQIVNQNIYFPYHPVFAYLAGTTCDKIMVDVKRQTPRDKLISLLEAREDVYDEIRQNYQLDYYILDLGFHQRQFSITSKMCQKIRYGATTLSYIICLLMACFIYVDHDVKSSESYFIFKSTVAQVVIRLLCILQLGSTLFYCWLWYKMRGKLALKKYKNSLQEQQQEQELEYPSTKDSRLFSGQYFKVIYLILVYHVLKSIRKIKRYLFNSKFYFKFIQPCLALWHHESESKTLLIFVIAAFAGNFYGYEWYTIHIFDYFVNIPMLANVFKAIIVQIDVLALLSLLAVTFTTTFNLLSLSTYIPAMYEQGVPDDSCSDIIGCILQFYTVGPVGGQMSEFHAKRFAFDTIYVVFMELIFQGLVSGIMIDTYNSLIAQDAERLEDKKGVCYICSKTKSNIEKEGATFKKHTDKHYLWNYLYYIYCLENKDPTNYTGIQYAIKNKIDSEDVSWFPSQGQGDQGNEIKQLTQDLEVKLTKMREQSISFVQKHSELLSLCNRSLKKKAHELPSAL